MNEIDLVDQAIDRGQIVIYAAYALIAVVAAWVGKMIGEEAQSRAAQENLEDSRDRKTTNGLLSILRPALIRPYLVPLIRGKPFWDEKRKLFRRKIIAAGLKDEVTPDEFIGLKLILILIFPIVCVILQNPPFEVIDFPWYVILGSGGLGWFYPNFWVNGRAAARQKQVLRAMPFIVDLLALSTEAGLDFIGAIGKVVEKANPSPLVEEFAQLLKEIKVGASRQEALREMAARIDLTEINSFAAILISADQMGASIGKILRQQSDQIRTQRIVKAEKAGVNAASKLQIAVLPVVGVVFLIVFAPVVLEWMGSGGGG